MRLLDDVKDHLPPLPAPHRHASALGALKVCAAWLSAEVEAMERDGEVSAREIVARLRAEIRRAEGAPPCASVIQFPSPEWASPEPPEAA